MSKSIIYLILIILIGGSFFLFSKKDTKKEEIQQVKYSQIEESSSLNESAESFEENTSIFEIAKRRGDFKCEFEQSDQGVKSTGIAYISGGKIRGDFFTEVNMSEFGVSNKIESHMISDGESVYTWTSLSKEGYKTKINQSTKKGNKDNFEIDYTSESLDYRCESQDVDSSKFLLPTNITFKTM
jgi:hypothetical protein